MVTALGLPLLIVDGKFQSLNSMTVEDLETFIPFLTKCSINRAGAQLINGIPEWWSSTIKYKFPLKKPSGLSWTGYRRHLSAIVCSCYWYHDAQYLLPFCAKIANTPESVSLHNNEDNTTSIFDVHNTCQVLKFNNENKSYDSKPKKENCSTKSLLSALPKIPVIIPDIYLCENCDAEFSCHSDMQKHEKECYEIVITGVKEKHNGGNGSIVRVKRGVSKRKPLHAFKSVKTVSSVKPNIFPSVGKKNFLNFLYLQPKSTKDSQGLPKPMNGMRSPCRWVNANLYLFKNRNIEFSSLIGRKLLQQSSKRDLSSKIEKNFMVNEYYCSTNSTSRTIREHKDTSDFRVTCKKPKKNSWTHQYAFSKKQRRNRYITLKTGLNESSRELLKRCKKLQVVLNRLSIDS